MLEFAGLDFVALALCLSLTIISLFENRHFAFGSHKSEWLKFLNVRCSSPSIGGGVHGAHNAFLLSTLLLVPPSLADSWPIVSGQELLLHSCLLEKLLVSALGQEVSRPAGGIPCLASA